MKAKAFSLVVDKRRYRAADATLTLSDYAQFGDYNHPVLCIVLRPECESPADADHDQVCIHVEFQRDRRHPEAEGLMDTTIPWSHSYGGHVEMGKADRFDLCDRPFSLCQKDKVRVAFARKLARVIRERNLHAVHPDHAMQARLALQDYMGVTVLTQYNPDFGDPVSPYSVKGRGAAQREREANAQREVA